MAMIQLYLDDAGSQTDRAKPVFTVGGYLGTTEQWADVIGAWQHVLDDMKAPGPYHAADCQWGSDGYGKGDFATWGRDQLIELHMRLAPLTHRLHLGVAIGVVVPDFNEALRDDPLFRDSVQGGRYLPLYFALETALHWIACETATARHGEKIAVMFERGTEGLGHVAAHAFGSLQDQMPWAAEAFTPTMALGTKACVPLQAADMLAHAAYKVKDNQLHHPHLPERMLLTELRREDRLHIAFAAKSDYPGIKAAYAAWWADFRKLSK